MKRSKVLLTLLCAVALVVTSVFGTLAYLKDDDSVLNTFTVGQVYINLDETDTDNSKTDVTPGSNPVRDKANAYEKILPGHTYVKDPTVTVEAGSSNAYVRMIVKVADMDKMKDAFPVDKYADFYSGDLFLLQKLVSGWNGDIWECVGYKNGAYEFRYHKIVNGDSGKLEPLFEKIVIPGAVTNEQIANLQNMQINVEAHAIQADGFTNAADAWNHFTA